MIGQAVCEIFVELEGRQAQDNLQALIILSLLFIARQVATFPMGTSKQKCMHIELNHGVHSWPIQLISNTHKTKDSKREQTLLWLFNIVPGKHVALQHFARRYGIDSCGPTASLLVHLVQQCQGEEQYLASGGSQLEQKW